MWGTQPHFRFRKSVPEILQAPPRRGCAGPGRPPRRCRGGVPLAGPGARPAAAASATAASAPARSQECRVCSREWSYGMMGS